VEFSTTDVIEYPVETVFQTHRDHLPELVDFLPNVEKIEVESREDLEGRVDLVNIWTAARSEVPTLVRPFVKPHMLTWIDRASWLESDHTCRWDIELGFLKAAIRCKGENKMRSNDDGHTEVTIAGQIEVDAKKIPGVPRFMAKKVGAAVEKFVVKTITPNLKKTNDGVRAYLAAQEEAEPDDENE
jgi:hypothetical protein